MGLWCRRAFLRARRLGLLVWLILFAVCLLEVLLLQCHLTTVAGDNLGAPPWHGMRRHTLWQYLSRMPTTWSCAHSCTDEDEPVMRGNTSDDDRLVTTNTTMKPLPGYFKWMLEDLSPWRVKGITRETLELAKKTAVFRVVIFKGKLYTELYYRCIQSRMMFTLWGLLNLLERFPTQVPDVELLFNCQDRPQVNKGDYSGSAYDAPPPLFGYCSTDEHFDIPFPDFSFWGWPEIQIKPWDEELRDILEVSKRRTWVDRNLNAYWRGNPWTTEVRKQLAQCSSVVDYHAQNWLTEVDSKDSRVSDHCNHRYKVYAEGYAWSASYKYSLACGSPLLAIQGKYYEFFTRGLVANKEFLPIQANDRLCESMDNVVNWGNSHPLEAEEIGSRGQTFAEQSLSMDHVYDYMLYLLKEYAGLQRFAPKVLPQYNKLCKKSVLCVVTDAQRAMLSWDAQQA